MRPERFPASVGSLKERHEAGMRSEEDFSWRASTSRDDGVQATGCAGFSFEAPTARHQMPSERLGGLSVFPRRWADQQLQRRLIPRKLLRSARGGQHQATAQADELARRLLRHFAQTFVGDVAYAGPLQLPHQIRQALPLRPDRARDMAIASSRSLAVARSRSGIPPSAAIWTDAPCTAQLPAHVEYFAVERAYLGYRRPG